MHPAVSMVNRIFAPFIVFPLSFFYMPDLLKVRTDLLCLSTSIFDSHSTFSTFSVIPECLYRKSRFFDVMAAYFPGFRLKTCRNNVLVNAISVNCYFSNLIFAISTVFYLVFPSNPRPLGPLPFGPLESLNPRTLEPLHF
jgi:hypothetical protein